MKFVHLKWNGEGNGNQYDCDQDIGEGGVFVPLDQLDKVTKRQNHTAFIAALIGAAAGATIAITVLSVILWWVYQGRFTVIGQ